MTDNGCSFQRATVPTSASTVHASSWLARRGLTPTEGAVLLAVGFFTVARGSFTFPTTLRLAVLVLVGLPGLVVLARRVAHRDSPAIALALFMLVALASGLQAVEPLNSVRGDILSYLSVVVLWLAAGWWAAGTWLGERARHALPWVLVTGVAVNATVAVLQIALDIRSGPLGTFAGRGSGLMDNAVYYGSLCSGVAAWAVYRAVREPGLWWMILVGGLSFAAGLSGSRASLAAVVVTGLCMLAIRRNRRAGAALMAAFAGFAFASWFVALVGSGPSLAGRAASVSGDNGRSEIWRYGFQAFRERPIFGWGPNQFGPATWHRYTLEFIRDTGWRDEHQPWTDPHNVVVLVLATMGVVGMLSLLAFLVMALRRVGCVELMVLAGGIAGTWLVQPTRNTLPIAMAALGAAALPIPSPGTESSVAGTSRTASVVACCLAVSLAAYLVAADVRLGRASRSDDATQITAAASWYYRDSVVAEFAASRLALRPVDREASIRWSTLATDYAAYSPRVWSTHAELLLALGELEGASVALSRSLELQLWSPSGRRVSVLYARAVGDEELATSAFDTACALRLTMCLDDSGSEHHGLQP